MNLLPIKFITRHQVKLLFIVVWAHVTILNLFYVNYAGPVFLWEKSIQAHTLFIHLTVALLTLAFYFLLIHVSTRFQINKAAKSLKTTKDSSY